MMDRKLFLIHVKCLCCRLLTLPLMNGLYPMSKGEDYGELLLKPNEEKEKTSKKAVISVIERINAVPASIK